MQSEVHKGNDAVNDRNDGLLCHLQGAALWHSFVEESKINSTRSTTEVKSINNERDDYPPEGSFIFLDKYGAAICNLCCISEIESIEEKLENDDAHGPDVEALWYLSLKVKEKSTTPPPPASTTDDSEPDRNLMHLIRVTAPVEVMYLTKKHSAPSMAKANQIDYMYTN